MATKVYILASDERLLFYLITLCDCIKFRLASSIDFVNFRISCVLLKHCVNLEPIEMFMHIFPVNAIKLSLYKIWRTLIQNSLKTLGLNYVSVHLSIFAETSVKHYLGLEKFFMLVYQTVCGSIAIAEIIGFA